MIPWEIHGSPYVQEHPAKKFAQDADFIGRGWPFGPPVFLGKKRHQNTRRSRVTAYANLEPPKGLGVGFGFGFGLRLGSGWSGPTCKVELTTHLLHKFLQDAPAHTGWFRLNAQNCVPD